MLIRLIWFGKLDLYGANKGRINGLTTTVCKFTIITKETLTKLSKHMKANNPFSKPKKYSLKPISCHYSNPNSPKKKTSSSTKNTMENIGCNIQKHWFFTIFIYIFFFRVKPINGK